jgi:hypothetical protein
MSFPAKLIERVFNEKALNRYRLSAAGILSTVRIEGVSGASTPCFRINR